MSELLNILHVDCDAFFASCEELRNPGLKNRPLAVGGLTNKSIITTANYKAREFGLHSAMPVFMARDLCPGLILLPVDRAYYSKKSKEIFTLIQSYSLNFEQVSIDEAYLEIEPKYLEEGLLFAKTLQKDILEKTGIGVSIGLSYNKFLAKIGSDWNKPHGIKIIQRKEVPDILLDLDINKVHGLGKVGEERLKSFGVYKISDLLKLDEAFLVDLFGKQGSFIYHSIRGEDKRKVGQREERKSLGREVTFRKNTRDEEELLSYLKDLSLEVEEDLALRNLQGLTVSLKLKDEDFKNHTRSLTLQEPIYRARDIYKNEKDLLESIKLDKKIRLIGVSLSKLSEKNQSQLSFL